MSRVLTTAERAERTAERDRAAWNLPRQPRATSPAPPGSRAPAAATPDAGSTEADEAAVRGLDWQAFLARYFPGRRRHDLEALAAYGAYRTAARPGGPEPASAESGAAESWEDDGGATR